MRQNPQNHHSNLDPALSLTCQTPSRNAASSMEPLRASWRRRHHARWARRCGARRRCAARRRHAARWRRGRHVRGKPRGSVEGITCTRSKHRVILKLHRKEVFDVFAFFDTPCSLLQDDHVERQIRFQVACCLHHITLYHMHIKQQNSSGS